MQDTGTIKVCRVLVLPVGIGSALLTCQLLRMLVIADFDSLRALLAAFLGTIASLCLWFSVRGHAARSRTLILASGMSGLIVGWVGFLIGFVGPMILAPQSNQGPLVGIFFTGPLGFVVGAVLGLVVGAVLLIRRS